MIKVEDKYLRAFKQTNALLINELLSRGEEVYVPYLGSSHLLIRTKNGEEKNLYNCVPSTTSFAAAALSDNKYATHTMLEESGIPVLPTVRLTGNEDVSAAYDKFPDDARLVVKPANSSHGDGITIGVDDRESFMNAVLLARNAGRSSTVIIQKMYEGAIDIRILCIDYKFISAVHRIPARVKGDGVHTVKELICIENSQPDRGERYIAQLSTIDIDRSALCMGGALLDVPSEGEWVEVMHMANYGAGGETAAITSTVPDWLIKMAEQAARTIQLPLCGVDFLISELPTRESTLRKLQPIITEINKSPSLYIHEHPTNTQGDSVVKPTIDYVLSRP